MPRKIRKLVADLEAAGFTNRGGKGSHRNFSHPKVVDVFRFPENSGTMPKSARSELLNTQLRRVGNE